jgi:hypothetical protein
LSIFNLHSYVLSDYRDFVRSFFTVADDRAREFIDHELLDERRLWPAALLQVSPSHQGRVGSPSVRSNFTNQAFWTRRFRRVRL